MRVTKEYLRNVIKESIEEVASGRKREYGGGQFKQSDVATGQEGENETVLNVSVKYIVDRSGSVQDCEVFDEAGKPVEMMGAAKKDLMGLCQQFYDEDTAESDRGSDAQAREDGGQGYMYEAEDKEPSDYAAEIQRGYTLHVYKNGKEVIEKPKGGHVSADELEKLKMLKGFRSDLAAAKARAKKAGYGK